MNRITFTGIIFCLLALTSNLFPKSLVHASPGSGNITIETRNIDNAQKELQKAATELKLTFKSYSDYKNSSNNKRAISANCLVDKTQAVAFINLVAGLGSVQSQSYYENQDELDLPAKEKKLKAFQRYLTKVLTSASPDPDVVALISQQVQSLEYEINRIKGEGQGKSANISIQIQEKGYNQQPFEFLGPKSFIKTVAMVLAFLCLMMGAVLGWLMAKYKFKNKKTA